MPLTLGNYHQITTRSTQYALPIIKELVTNNACYLTRDCKQVHTNFNKENINKIFKIQIKFEITNGK